MVDVSADPMVISSGQSSTLKADVELDRGIATDPSSTNSQNGAMFDLQASDSVVITGFTVSSTLDTGTTNIEIFYKTGTHVGSEGNSNAWTSIGTYNGVSEGDGIYLALNTPLTIIAGQTLAFYITSTDGSRLHYGNGTGVGNVYASAGGLKLLEGKGLVYPFGTTYSPRILATIVHYTVKNVTNATYNWSSGGSSASVVVSPSNSTNYTVGVGLNGCSETGSVSVGIIGINEDELASYEVYPNPAHDFINVSFNGSHKEVTISLFDLTGRVVYTKTVAPDAESTVIPVNNMPKGLYLLKLEQNASMRVFRIEVL